jgi:hypothetical protein
MPDTIGSVTLRGIPSKIVKLIIQSVAVVMARFHPFGTWPDERFQDQAVNRSGTQPGKIDLKVTAAPDSRLQPMPFLAEIHPPSTLPLRPDRTVRTAAIANASWYVNMPI